MQTKILFMTSRYFYEPTVHALSHMDLSCATKVVFYDNFRQILPVYDQYAPDFDAVLISGSSAKHVIDMRYPDNRKPVVAFQIDSDAFYRDLLLFAIEKQDLDFSRIAVDCLVPLDAGCSVVDFLHMSSTAAIIHQNAKLMRTTFAADSNSMDNHILERITQLWKAETIDMVICLYSSIAPALQELGIPFRCPFISDAKLYQLIQAVLVKIELNQLHENHPAIIQVFPRHSGAETAEQVRKIHGSLQQFIQGQRIDGILQNNGQCCTIICTMGILRYLTNEFQICQISAFLAKALDFPVSVGYGIGTTVNHAMNNVQIASKEAKILGDSFLVDSNGNLFGPLNSEHRMVIPFSSQPDVSDIAKRCSLSAMTIQKLQSIVRSNESNKITIPEIAQKLNTTVRNANRIMLNLCKGNVAKAVYTQTTHSRGRPIQVYALDFETPHK